MGNKQYILILVAAAAAVARAQISTPDEVRNAEARYTQDGDSWVRTISGEAPAHTHLAVSARAKIVLRGGPGDRITFKLVQKIRARSEAEARRFMGAAMGETHEMGNLTRMIVTPLGTGVISELDLSVPHQVSAAHLETQGGDIEAYDFEGSVDAGTLFGQILADRIGGSFAAHTGGGPIHLGKIGGAVHCISGGGAVYLENPGGETNCATAGGDMTVREAGGPLQLSTEGNIRVDRAASTVEAHSSAGIIEVGYAAGAVVADTRGGSIQVGSARGVRAESAQGAVRVKSASGAMSISTAVGNILAELLSGSHFEDSTLMARSGDITVFIPSNMGVTVMARNDSGGSRIVSDFPEVHVHQPGLIQAPLSAQGAIHGGGPVLFINATGGAIYLRRSK